MAGTFFPIVEHEFHFTASSVEHRSFIERSNTSGIK